MKTECMWWNDTEQTTKSADQFASVQCMKRNPFLCSGTNKALINPISGHAIREE